MNNKITEFDLIPGAGLYLIENNTIHPIRVMGVTKSNEDIVLEYHQPPKLQLQQRSLRSLGLTEDSHRDPVLFLTKEDAKESLLTLV